MTGYWDPSPDDLAYEEQRAEKAENLAAERLAYIHRLESWFSDGVPQGWCPTGNVNDECSYHIGGTTARGTGLHLCFKRSQSYSGNVAGRPPWCEHDDDHECSCGFTWEK
jgi:hypothetical protein